jgi:hypothetical protein
VSAPKIEYRQLEIQYVLTFGDSMNPEKFVFTEAEIKLLFAQMKDLLYGPGARIHIDKPMP